MSAAYPCGTIIATEAGYVRHFCRQSSCRTCLMFATSQRLYIFQSRCGEDADFVAMASQVKSFDAFRTSLHDKIDYRRRTLSDRRWKRFGMFCRFSQGVVIGVVARAELGMFDLKALMPGATFGAVDLSGVPAVVGCFPMKAMFLTINPQADRSLEGSYGLRRAKMLGDEGYGFIM